MADPITRVELFHVAVPLPATFYPSWIPSFPQTANSFTLIRLTTRSGLIGVSAGVAMEEEREGLGSLLGPYLIDADALDVEAAQQRLREASYLGWRNAWIEAAFWDIRGQAEGKPLYQLLSGSSERVDEVDVYLSMGELHRGDSLARYIDEARRRNVRGVKVRVHSMNEEVDLDALRQARQLAGPDLALMVDANQGWRVALLSDAPLWDLARATRFGRACDEADVRWLEEPLDMYDYDAQAELRRRIDTPVAGGELNAGWHELKVMLDKGCYDIYQPDATFAGGIGQVRRLMNACERDPELGFSPHTWSNGIGFLVGLHLFAAWPRRSFLEYPYQPPGWVPSARDGILKEPIEITPRGTVEVPQRPGLGAEIDPRALRRYGRRFFNLTRARLALHTIRRKGLKTTLELGRIKKRAARREAG